MVTIGVDDFKLNVVALIDSGADQNSIKDGIIPTLYCSRTKEQLSSANGSTLNIKYKLDKGYVCNNDYCFTNTFLIIQNITHDVILGTPFLTQIYHFYVNETGVHSTIMGRNISFKFLSPIKQKDVTLFQYFTIFKQINLIEKNHFPPSMEEFSYSEFEEQITNPSGFQHILNNIFQGTIRPISRALEFAVKFPVLIANSNHLQKFSGCLNYVSNFFQT